MATIVAEWILDPIEAANFAVSAQGGHAPLAKRNQGRSTMLLEAVAAASLISSIR